MCLEFFHFFVVCSIPNRKYPIHRHTNIRYIKMEAVIGRTMRPVVNDFIS